MKTATATKWTIDQTHSEVQFKVKHLVISTVTGTFNHFNGHLESSEEDFDNAEVFFEVDVNSIDTNVADRDNHLRSADFFDAENHPKMPFKGKLVKQTPHQFDLVGDLTIKGHSQKVSLNAELGGIAPDPYGNTKAGFEIQGAISRKAFGLTWNQVTEAGGVVVGDEVKMHFNIQLTKG